MEKFRVKALVMIGNWNRRVKELQEKEISQLNVDQTAPTESEKKKMLAISVERQILQSITTEIKRFLKMV